RPLRRTRGPVWWQGPAFCGVGTTPSPCAGAPNVTGAATVPTSVESRAARVRIVVYVTIATYPGGAPRKPAGRLWSGRRPLRVGVDDLRVQDHRRVAARGRPQRHRHLRHRAIALAEPVRERQALGAGRRAVQLRDADAHLEPRHVRAAEVDPGRVDGDHVAV